MWFTLIFVNKTVGVLQYSIQFITLCCKLFIFLLCSSACFLCFASAWFEIFFNFSSISLRDFLLISYKVMKTTLFETSNLIVSFIGNELLIELSLLVDVIIRYQYWPHIEDYYWNNFQPVALSSSSCSLRWFYLGNQLSHWVLCCLLVVVTRFLSSQLFPPRLCSNSAKKDNDISLTKKLHAKNMWNTNTHTW